LNAGYATSGTEVQSEGELIRTMPDNLTDVEKEMSESDKEPEVEVLTEEKKN
jgi:hypothetical protein